MFWMFTNFANIFIKSEKTDNFIFSLYVFMVARLGFCLYLCTLNVYDKRKVGYFIKVLKINEL